MNGNWDTRDAWVIWTSLQDLQLNHCEFGKPPQYEIARKICFPGVEILEGFIADSYVRLFGFLSFIWCSWFFLFALKLWGAYYRKEKANLAQIRQFKITFILLYVDPIQGLLNFFISFSPSALLNATTKHVFSNCCHHVTLRFIPYIFVDMKCDFSKFCSPFIYQYT